MKVTVKEQNDFSLDLLKFIAFFRKILSTKSRREKENRMENAEMHRTNRIGWLRAGVLGANDGIVSTASLIVGVAAAEASRNSVLLAGIAGLVAGAMSMAA